MKTLFSTYSAIGDTESIDVVPKRITFQSYESPYIYLEETPDIEEKVVVSPGLFEHLQFDKPDLVESNTKKKKPITESKGLKDFNKFYDEVEKLNPDAKKYRDVLTRLAKAESNFNSYIQNTSGAPAYGYFQFMLDGKKYNNISRYAGTDDVEAFRNNPMLQINAAVRMIKEMDNTLSKQDLETAKKKGYSKDSLLAGAWLGGVGGVRDYLYNRRDASDGATSVSKRIKEFNS